MPRFAPSKSVSTAASSALHTADSAAAEIPRKPDPIARSLRSAPRSRATLQEMTGRFDAAISADQGEVLRALAGAFIEALYLDNRALEARWAAPESLPALVRLVNLPPDVQRYAALVSRAQLRLEAVAKTLRGKQPWASAARGCNHD